MACGRILAPWLGIEPLPSALKACSPNHRTASTQYQDLYWEKNKNSSIKNTYHSSNV